MKITIHIILLPLLFFSLESGFGQSVRFRHLNIDNGLPVQKINKVHTDKTGYVWLESEEGVFRFDGTEFKSFEWPSIPSIGTLDSLDQIFLGRDNKFYGLLNNQIYYAKSPCTIYRTKNIIKTKSGIFIHHKNVFEENELTYIQNKICKKYILKKDSLVLIDGSPVHIPPENTDGLEFSIASFSSDEIIMNIPQNSMMKINWANNELISIPTLKKNPSEHPALHALPDSEGIWKIRKDSLHLWGPRPRFFPLKNKVPKIEFLRVNSFSAFFADRENAFFYNLLTEEIKNLNTELNIRSEINHLELDAEENLWIATKQDGVFCIYNDSPEQNNRGLLGDAAVHHLYPTSSLGLLAATDEGLFLISTGWSRFPLKEGKQPASYFIGEDKTNNIIYVSTNDGVYMIEKGMPSLCLPREKNMLSFLVDNKGTLSFFRNKFLNSYLSCGSNPVSWPAPDSDVEFCLFQDSQQRVWMGTEGGLLIYGNGQFAPRKITTEKGLPHSKVNDIREDEKKNIWVGTDGGLSVISGDSFNIKNYKNLPSLKCRKILPDQQGRVWISSPDGVFLFDKKNEGTSQRLNIPESQVNSLYLKNDKQLWLGTNKGLFRHKTDEQNLEEAPPILFWKHILLDNNSVNHTDIPDLTSKGKLEIGYSVLAFKDPRLVSYQYRLKENDNWQNTPNRNLFFSNLQTGKYNLQIRARKPGSDWSEPLEFSFCSLPPWWKSTGFIVSSLLGFALLIGFILFTIRAREKKRMETNRRFAELELKALQSQMNPHFIFNTLNAIQHAILKEDAHLANESLNSFASLMRLFLESSKAKYIPLADEIRMLGHYCELTRLCYEGKFDFKIKVDKNIDAEDTEIPSMLLQPHVENAIRHGLLPKKEKGLLEIVFSSEEDELICHIRDNGIGRKAAKILKEQSSHLHKSTGMALTSERADILNEIYDVEIDISIQDLEDKTGKALGTDVCISFLLD